jgi:hypothetical protein
VPPNCFPGLPTLEDEDNDEARLNTDNYFFKFCAKRPSTIEPQLHQSLCSGGRIRHEYEHERGTYVTAGSQLIALVDASSYWVAGYFKEIQLPHIKVSQMANITMMGYENQPFQGVVRSVGWGIYVQDGSGSASTALLPSVNPTAMPVCCERRCTKFTFREFNGGMPSSQLPFLEREDNCYLF